MNKTININLGSIFFHIDENAYQKLKTYLDSIRRSLSDDPQGKDEIIADIEARIAELLTERVKNERQVINETDIEEVTKVMGQPEDYAIDEDIFEDQPRTRKRSSNKKLFRDRDDKFLGGVSSGLAHYVGMDTFWMRIIWIILTPLTSGMTLLLYPFLWILLPVAETTAEKLQMKGEAVTISTIEKKIREEFADISEHVKEGANAFSEKIKNTEYNKYEKQAKSGIQDILETIGKLFRVLFKIFGKLIGALIIFISAATLIGLIVGLFSWGSFEILGFGNDMIKFPPFIYDSIIPFWLLGLFFFLAIGIPFIILFIIGLRILSNNVKSLGLTTKLSLLGIWIIAILGLSFSGIEFAARHAHVGVSTIKENLLLVNNAPLKIKMINNEELSNRSSIHYRNDYETVYDGDTKNLLSSRIRLDIRQSDSNNVKIKIRKNTEAKSRLIANNSADAIEYEFNLNDNNLLLNSYFLSSISNKFKDQSVHIIVYLPIGSSVYLNANTRTFIRNIKNIQYINDNDMAKHNYKMTEDGLYCLDCDEDDYGRNYDPENDTFNLSINSNRLKLKMTNNTKSTEIKIDTSGITID